MFPHDYLLFTKHVTLYCGGLKCRQIFQGVNLEHQCLLPVGLPSPSYFSQIWRKNIRQFLNLNNFYISSVASQTHRALIQCNFNPILMENMCCISKDPLPLSKVTSAPQGRVTECATLAMLLHQQHVMISIQSEIFFVASLITHPPSILSHPSSLILYLSSQHHEYHSIMNMEIPEEL